MTIRINPLGPPFDFVMSGAAGNGILTINNVSPDGGGNFTIAGSGGISIDSTTPANGMTIGSNSGAFTWNRITGTSAAMVAGNGYILANNATTTVSLPSSGTNALGDTIKIVALIPDCIVTQDANQQIAIGGAFSTFGATGTITCDSSVGFYNSITLICVQTVLSQFIWVAVDAPQGTWTTT